MTLSGIQRRYPLREPFKVSRKGLNHTKWECVTGLRNPEKLDMEFDAASKFGVAGRWREDVACERYKGMKAQV